MKTIISRLQKEAVRLQDTIQKESNDLLDKIQLVELIENIETKKVELERLVLQNLKKLEPACMQFVNELKKNAVKAGIDINKIEKELKAKANAASNKFKDPVKSKKKATKKKKSTSTAKKTSKSKSTPVKKAKKVSKKTTTVKKASKKKAVTKKKTTKKTS